MHRAAIGVVDEDGSQLSGRLISAFRAPQFQPPELIRLDEIDRVMNAAPSHLRARYSAEFRSRCAGRAPAHRAGVLVDATAMMQAGIGASYIQQMVLDETQRFLARNDAKPARPAVDLQWRFAFNQDLNTPRFTGVMALIDNITMLSILLAGAALVRRVLANMAPSNIRWCCPCGPSTS